MIGFCCICGMESLNPVIRKAPGCIKRSRGQLYSYSTISKKPIMPDNLVPTSVSGGSSAAAT